MRAVAPLASFLLLAATFVIADPVVDPGAGDDAVLARKLDTYIVCMNRHSDRVVASRDRYRSWVGDRGPTGREKVIYGLYEIYDPAECLRTIPAVASLPPELPELHAAGAAWVEAIAQARDLIAVAYRYYDMENFKDDRMQRGKELHGPLMQVFDRFVAADRQLSEQVRRHAEALQTRQLERLAADPERRSDYLLLASLRHARAALNLARPSGDRSFEREAFDAELARFEVLLDELEQRPALPQPIRRSAMSGYLRNGRDFLRTGKTLSRMHRDRKRHDTFFLPDNPELVEGHPGRMLHEFNRMVDDYNRI
jgi:hypothetical protein